MYGGYVRKLSKKTQEEVAAANVIAEEAFGSMRTVRSLCAEAQACREFHEKLMSYMDLNVKESLAYTALAFLSTLLPVIVTILVLLYGGRLVLENKISSGDLYCFMLYQISLSSSFNIMADVFTSFSSALGAAQKVAELIDTDQTSHLTGGHSNCNGIAGNIVMRNIHFRYPARPDVKALCGLSLQVKAGESLALVGPSGSGKSSCIQLLKRFYEPEEGHIYIDNILISEYLPSYLHRSVALVSQEPVLFCRSILDNILYGYEDLVPDADKTYPQSTDRMDKERQASHRNPNMEDVYAAARLANAHDFISALPEGYNTICGEKGVSLSGGQKQRVAIARALVRKPNILLLDEATSALDSESEHTVQKAIDALMENSSATVILVAHRLSTVQNADCIAYIEKGVCMEKGTHSFLLQDDNSKYAQLVRRQLSGEKA